MNDFNETELAAFRELIEDRLQAIADENVLGAVGQSVVTLDQQAMGRLSRMDALQYQVKTTTISRPLGIVSASSPTLDTTRNCNTNGSCDEEP